MDAKEATKAVREYFESIKKIKFIFDVRNVRYDEEDDAWIVECEVQNVFDEEPISYEIGVSDETGEILYVEEIGY
ncbi:MAG: hypothetical protein KKA10_05455 [Euryarchaeota archaeon]|nr:hypothetical protein [Euryarchaeota archaeon]MCG2735457.1 hypothetical protein [Candidatus Methanoperedenaceae archaeon]